MQKATKLRRAWDTLKLGMLCPSSLTPEQIEVALLMRSRADTAEKAAAFCQGTPFVVARFPESVTKEILNWAHRTDRTVRTREVHAENLPPVLGATRDAYLADVKAIHLALFGRRAPRVITYDDEIGFFSSRRSALLHADGDNQPLPAAAYIARLGNLPLEVIDGVRLSNASQADRTDCDAAQGQEWHEPAQASLRRKGLLRPVPLGDVALLATGPHGTLHCSSPVPPGGAPSAFFRVLQSLPLKM